MKLIQPRVYADEYLRTVFEHELDVTVIALGPATNIAAALTSLPNASSSECELVLACGCLGTALGLSSVFGAVDPVEGAEFNAHYDPAALQAVLQSRIPIVVIPMDTYVIGRLSAPIVVCGCA